MSRRMIEALRARTSTDRASGPVKKSSASVTAATLPTSNTTGSVSAAAHAVVAATAEVQGATMGMDADLI